MKYAELEAMGYGSEGTKLTNCTINGGDIQSIIKNRLFDIKEGKTTE